MKKIYSYTEKTYVLFFSKSVLSSLIFLTVLLSCSKEEVKPTSPDIPKEEIRYPYTIENISDETLYTFNNDATNPKENYAEVKLSAGQKIMVQALSTSKITPMIRPEKPGLQTEFIYSNLTKVYQINGFMNLFEASVTGDASLVSIYFPNPVSGKPDSLINVKLPQELMYKTYGNQNIAIIVSKEVVQGTINLTTRIKGKADISKSTSASQGIISSSTDLTKKTTTVKVVEPIAVVSNPATPNPGNPASPGNPTSPANPTSPTNPVPPTTPASPATPPSCGMYNGKPVYTGPRGGCYYINSNGNKTYVERNFCC